MKLEDRVRRVLRDEAARTAPANRWDDIERGGLRRPGHQFDRRSGAPQRALVIVLALALTTTSIVLVARAFRGPSSTVPATSVADGAIAFGVIGPRSASGGPLAQDIDVVAPDGRGLRNLTPDNAQYFDPAWSPDGAKIAYVRLQQDGGSFDEGIYVANADGTEATKIYGSGLPIPISVSDLAWSPDGSKIGFIQTKSPAQGSEADALMQLMVMNADGSGVTALGGGTASDGGQITSFSWSPDGDRVVFTRQISQGGHLISNLFVMSADGTDVSQLTNDGDSMRPSWSPDGSQIVFEVPSDDYHRRSIYVTDATGAGRTRLTNGPWMDGAPVWSPDGKQIAFVRVDGESSITFGIRTSSLMVMNADGTDQHVIVTAEEANGSPTTPSWQPVAAQPSASPSASQVMSTSPGPSQAVKVPNVTGVSFNRARQLLADVGLKVGTVQVVTGTYTEAVVTQQTPSAGTAVDEGSSVDIVTGPGPAEASSG